jgi:hypothetical protein
MKTTNPAEWQSGFWRADADIRGGRFGVYPAASKSFREGYRARVALLEEHGT